MTHAPESRVRLRHVLRGAWLTLISVLVIVDHVALSRWTRDVQVSTDETERTALERLAALEERVDAVNGQPTPVSESTFTVTRQALEERLVALEQAISDTARPGDLVPLHEHLSQLEARISKIRRPSQTPPPSSPPQNTEPQMIEPPFKLLGTELRGGERFLSLVPVHAHSLAHVTLLRVGEVHGDWRLEALNEKTAYFRVDGRMQRIELP